jgi:hypothetical protein
MGTSDSDPAQDGPTDADLLEDDEPQEDDDLVIDVTSDYQALADAASRMREQYHLGPDQPINPAQIIQFMKAERRQQRDGGG